MTSAVPHGVVSSRSAVADLERALAGGRDIIVSDDSVQLDDVATNALLATLELAGVGTASPVPAPSAPVVSSYPLHEALPPAPSVALPCPHLCAISARAVASMAGFHLSAPTLGEALVRIGEAMLEHGWRHAAVPGVALRWRADEAALVRPVAGWTPCFVTSQVGPADAGLGGDVCWAESQLRQVTVAVDGACLTDEPFTGTQHLVVEVSRWMAAVRPSATILLAVHASQVESVRFRLADSRVSIVPRSNNLEADVVYRPYQMLYASELAFVTSVGRRGLVGQLDMIGFANPSYHPTDQLAFFARNLQRYLMRSLDGVTFISSFGRESAFAECPDLDRDRLHVVSCGADPRPLPGALDAVRTFDGHDGFVTCLSSTFWHKNRTHAIATFAALVERHGYRGDLVVSGPEPYYGRSTGAEDALLSTLPADVRARVHRWGHVSDDEKWWLLRHADLALYPSIVEGFGLVPFEAAAVGTPCLAHSGTAPGELLTGTSALVDSWDPATWATRAAEIIADSAQADDVVAAIVSVTERHTWQRCAELTWLAIDHAMASPRRTFHADDGGHLARIAVDPHRRSPAGTLRFNVARGVPALRRRVVAAARATKASR